MREFHALARVSLARKFSQPHPRFVTQKSRKMRLPRGSMLLDTMKSSMDWMSPMPGMATPERILKPECARQRQHEHEHAVEGDRAFARHAPFVHGEADEVLEHRDHRRERRERHEDEEQRAPNVAERHLPEDDRKRDEHERGALIGADAVGEAGGEDDESREYGDNGVQRRHGDGLARQRALFPM